MNDIKIDDRIINPDHIVYIDLNAEVPGFGHEKTESAVKIVLSVLEGEVSAGFLDPKTLTYTGSKAEVLRPFLDKMFSCEGRSIRLPKVSSVEDVEPKLSSGIRISKKHKYVCQLNGCNVRVSRNGYFCSDECAELFEEQIPF